MTARLTDAELAAIEAHRGEWSPGHEVMRLLDEVRALKAERDEARKAQRGWREAGAAEAEIHGATMARLDEAEVKLDAFRALANMHAGRADEAEAERDEARRVFNECMTRLDEQIERTVDREKERDAARAERDHEARAALSAEADRDRFAAEAARLRDLLVRVVGHAEPESGHAVLMCFAGRNGDCVPLCAEIRAALTSPASDWLAEHDAKVRDEVMAELGRMAAEWEHVESAVQALEKALRRFGCHPPSCAATKVIGRMGSRSGLAWSAGDEKTCDCGLRRALAATTSSDWLRDYGKRTAEAEYAHMVALLRDDDAVRPRATLAEVKAALAERDARVRANTHLPPRSRERLAWLREREHCRQCLKTPIEEDRRGWASPTCHDCMPDATTERTKA